MISLIAPAKTLDYESNLTIDDFIYAFKGDVYMGLEANSLTKREINYAQKHLGILSGLYGLLKPLDLIYPYRLEMGTKMQTKKGKNLYEFWGNKITNHLNTLLKSHKNKGVINLASVEYFSSVNSDELIGPCISPVFKDYKNGKYKIISFYAKKARGWQGTSFRIKSTLWRL